MNDFFEVFKNFDYERFNSTILNADKNRIKKILGKDEIEYDDFLVLISESALEMLPEIAQRARNLTIKRFGKVINFYAPVYLSNECSNGCIYCGFNNARDIKRTTLGFGDIEKEYEFLKKQGFDNVLLLTGESPKNAGTTYIKKSVELARKYFTYVGLEIFPMSTEDYSLLVDAGASGLTIYQETYDETTYSKVHPRGKKSDFKWRITTPDRAFSAGFRKVGLGSLLGINDWRYEAAILGLHATYLRKKYWKGEVTLSFPRINPVETGYEVPYTVSDRELGLMISALRLLLPESGFILSTRERPEFRNNLIDLCITQLSAGSNTSPGGYSGGNYETQFEVSDRRDLDEMVELLKSKGYDPVLKDWENNFCGIR